MGERNPPIGDTSYSVSSSYSDFGAVAIQTYPTGETGTTNYNAADALQSLTHTLAGITTTRLGATSYTASTGLLSSATLGNGVYTSSVGYDGLLRPGYAKARSTTQRRRSR